MWPGMLCMLHAACCMLHVACCTKRCSNADNRCCTMLQRLYDVTVATTCARTNETVFFRGSNIAHASQPRPYNACNIWCCRVLPGCLVPPAASDPTNAVPVRRVQELRAQRPLRLRCASVGEDRRTATACACVRVVARGCVCVCVHASVSVYGCCCGCDFV
jgi:hypothetical protein